MLRLLLVFLALVSCARAESVYERVSARVVCLATDHKDGSRSVGSGFFIAPGIMATVEHQILNAKRVRFFLPSGAEANCAPLDIKTNRDAAVLKMTCAGPGVLRLAETQPLLGMEVFTVGCPHGLSQTLTRGVVSHPARVMEGRKLIQTDLAINAGNSGGPLVNTAGEVVGVVHGQLMEANGINFAIPIAEYARLAGKLGSAVPANPDLAELWAAASRGEPEERAQRYLLILLRAPGMAEAYYNLGLVRLGQGRLEEARELFQTASLKKVPYPEALNNLGLALFRLHRHEAARDALIRAVSARPNFALAHYNLGVVYDQGLGDAASATRNFQRYLELSPSAPQSEQARRWLLGQRK